LGLNAVGQPLFPGLTVTGGTLLGAPVVASQAVGNQIIFVHAPSILIADEGGIEIDVSREASVYLDSRSNRSTGRDRGTHLALAGQLGRPPDGPLHHVGQGSVNRC